MSLSRPSGRKFAVLLPTNGRKKQPEIGNNTANTHPEPAVTRWTALLDEWRLGLARMRGHPPPQGFSEAAWQQLKLDAFALFATHGPRLAALGWRTDELFGLHREAPAVRVNASGLARFLHGGAIVELTDAHARIRQLTGSTTTYYRVPAQHGAVPAWKFHQQGETVMTDYSTDLDTGQLEQGPWLAWHAAPTRDGAHAAGTWSVKDSAGRATVNLTPGFVVDWPNSRTGWIQAGGITGVAPQKRWNASRAKFERQPGDDWKRAMHVQIAYTPEARAVWEQNSAAAWMGFVDLMTLLKDVGPRNLPNLPLIAFTGHRAVKLGNGMTLVPQFRLIRFVARPDCLPDDDAAAPQPSGDPWGGSPTVPAATPAQPQPPSGANGTGTTAASPALPGFGMPTPAPTASDPLIDDEIPF